MTSGASGISNRRVLRIALPIVVSNATIPLLGAADTAIVGQLGQAAPIGAVPPSSQPGSKPNLGSRVSSACPSAWRIHPSRPAGSSI